ncbi:hypothetical protein JMJ55_19160 [Belnapia sp. T6]|uniref:Uncharacterized protein n=1 Tax=Belnapia mucosa TaxID=2804532 RepID=A0ABS1V712_9PROT|nr:hypothetical protein [Belnapia mucosa]MBL6457456.1 hypothetical protein [Belnapia mucosa]
MALSDTARRILAEAAQHPLRLAASPDKLPVAAARAVLSSLLKQDYVEESEAPDEFAGLRWHQQDGTRPTMRITAAGLAIIGATPVNAAVEDGDHAEAVSTVPADAAQEPGSAPLAPPTAPEGLVAPTGTEAAQAHSTRPACATPPTASSAPGMTRSASAPTCPTP